MNILFQASQILVSKLQALHNNRTRHAFEVRKIVGNAKLGKRHETLWITLKRDDESDRQTTTREAEP